MKPFKGVKWHTVETKFTINRFKKGIREELNTYASEQNYGYDLWKSLWASLGLGEASQFKSHTKPAFQTPGRMNNSDMKNIVLCASAHMHAKYCKVRKTLVWKYILQY